MKNWQRRKRKEKKARARARIQLEYHRLINMRWGQATKQIDDILDSYRCSLGKLELNVRP